MVTAGVIGATGYAGAQLVSLLANHPHVSLAYLGSHSYVGKRFSSIYPSMQGGCDLVLEEEDLHKASELCSVLFLPFPMALPVSA